LGENQPRMLFTPFDWADLVAVSEKSWKCGYCDAFVSSNRGYKTTASHTVARPCPRCKGISMFPEDLVVYPPPVPGQPVEGVNSSVADLYDEARKAAGAGAYTAAVMACRKLLMNIAVAEGAKEGAGFKDYIIYLENQGMFSPKAKTFVEYIKDLGNEANHEIAPKTHDEAVAVIDFVGSLLRHNYETPSRVPQKLSQATSE
jgi:hypothetical protein